jgi:carbamate kinase
VDAACRFVEQTGGLAVIASLDAAVAAVHGTAGTRIRP